MDSIPCLEEVRDNILKRPVATVGRAWTVKELPGRKTFGITEPINFLTTSIRRGAGGQLRIVTGGRQNNLFEMCHLVMLEGLMSDKAPDAIIADMPLSYFVGGDPMRGVLSNYREEFEARKTVKKASGKKIWDSSGLHMVAGNFLDQALKDIFNGKSPDVLTPGVQALSALFGRVLALQPVAGGLRVAMVKGMVEYPPGDPRRCCDVCESKYVGPIPVTEIDLVAWDPARSEVVLVELKTHKNANLDAREVRRFQLQSWISWMAFAQTYPSLRCRTRAIIVAVSLSHGTVRVFNVRPPQVTKRILEKFPIMKHFCTKGYQVLTPRLAKPAIKGPCVTAVIGPGGAITVAECPKPQPMKYEMKRRLPRPRNPNRPQKIEKPG